MLQLPLQRGLNQISQNSQNQISLTKKRERTGNEAGEDKWMETTGWGFGGECPLRKGGQLEIGRPKESLVPSCCASSPPGNLIHLDLQSFACDSKHVSASKHLLSRVWGQAFKSQYEMQNSSPVVPTTVLELPPNPGHTGTVLSLWCWTFHINVTCSCEGSQISRGKNCFILLWHLFSGLRCPILTSSDCVSDFFLLWKICAGSRGSPSALLLQVMGNQFPSCCSVIVVQPNPQDTFCNTKRPAHSVCECWKGTSPEGLTPDRCIRKLHLGWGMRLTAAARTCPGWIWSQSSLKLLGHVPLFSSSLLPGPPAGCTACATQQLLSYWSL